MLRYAEVELEVVDGNLIVYRRRDLRTAGAEGGGVYAIFHLPGEADGVYAISRLPGMDAIPCYRVPRPSFR